MVVESNWEQIDQKTDKPEDMAVPPTCNHFFNNLFKVTNLFCELIIWHYPEKHDINYLLDISYIVVK